MGSVADGEGKGCWLASGESMRSLRGEVCGSLGEAAKGPGTGDVDGAPQSSK